MSFHCDTDKKELNVISIDSRQKNMGIGHGCDEYNVYYFGYNMIRYLITFHPINLSIHVFCLLPRSLLEFPCRELVQQLRFQHSTAA